MDDPPDAASRIGSVTYSAWNEMNMGVHDGLPRCNAVIDADVDAISL